MMRRIWMHKIYNYICSYYLIKNPNSIFKLECILFLMQIESIEKYGKLFYKYKTYVYQKQIRIPYLSDLLRVSPIILLSNDHIYGTKKIDKYLKMFKKYSKLSENEIYEKIDSIISKNIYKKYWSCSVYENGNLRRIARLRVNHESRGILKSLLRKIFGFLSFAYLFGLLCCKYYEYIFSEEIKVDFQDITQMFIILTLIFGIIWWIWTWKWMQPTEYEILNKEKQEHEN